MVESIVSDLRFLLGSCRCPGGDGTLQPAASDVLDGSKEKEKRVAGSACFGARSLSATFEVKELKEVECED
jgi:hypothetical protein